MVPVLPRDSLRTILAYLSATGNYLAGAKCHLFQNNIQPADNTTISQLVEATFDGYVAGNTITWDVPYSDVGNNAVMVGTLQQFLMNASTTPNVIYGAYLTDSTGATLLVAIRFDVPVNMNLEGDAVIYVPQVSLGQPPV